jgi:CheY-like chemotaxis protein
MTRPRILVVDDDATLLQAIHGTFELRLPEVNVDTCESGVRVMEHINARDYGAIICDMNMPVMNGLQVLRELKQVRPWTPFLLMTGNDREDLVAEAAKAGAYDFIKKPVNRDMLVLSVQRALEAHQWRGDRNKDTILCLEGFPPSTSIERFRNWVAQYGKVLRVRLVLDTDETNVRSAYGYVEFASSAEAEHARHNLADGARFDDQIHISSCHDAFIERSQRAFNLN